ncbi:alpha alpha-trehalose-phosphate synthase [UDP-forming] 1 [Phtheirospermum japonicum]|uniref:alpha,alpha-trehalose-phosphate synthase (UDP-forming) n=1 Tax=Phtheirospermum japonicum TaxID=374723 RepID=A0A830D6Y9_9LAMI|nr:alpha alpha-trehalose-phosphate synthase [UDP-forming] 1 [Phtheirospermum japonicum]
MSRNNNRDVDNDDDSHNSSQVPCTRVSRLLRERELRRATTDASDSSTVLEIPDSDDFSGSHGAEQSSFGILEEGGGGVVPNEEREKPPPFRQRLLVVANRLPVSAVRKGEDAWSLEISAGGLVSALLGVKEFEARWIGWAGVNVPDEVGKKALTKALAEKRCVPVFLDEELVHQYYNGYCNNILWPLFHYLGLPHEDQLSTTRSIHQSQFAAYRKANQMFADVVNQHYEEGDVVWCHDYHLMFLPKCLKEHNSDIKVGWFLHTPFPSSEIHRTLPSRSELLHAVLAADLVGFHTYDYARHFVSACTRILGLEGTPEGVEDQGRVTRVAAFPIGIDSERFFRALQVPQVQDHIKELKERFAGRKVMLGVDRLDMIKGIPQKILAFEKFLEENPDWHDKVVLLQIAVPTRTDVAEYQKLSSQVHEIVGRINGRFGTLTAVPIHHLDRSLEFNALCALYAVTDVTLITSLRDGMNLVSYESVACQTSKKGVLILSEFAGAAQSLGAGALLVNPWNITEVAAAIGHALTMPVEEREKRYWHNFNHVTTHSAQQWAEFFVSELNDTVIEAQQRVRKVPPQLVFSDAINAYLQSKNRLLILGFNAAMTEPVEIPGGRGGDQIKEMELKLHPDLKAPLTLLCSDPNTTIVILSGSDRSILDNNFGEYNMWLAAENGMFLRNTKGHWMSTMPELLNMDWVDSVKHVLEYFTERTPRSHFELRETSLVWNYKYSDVEFGRLQARDMLQHLWTGPISNAAVDVVQGSRTVEVRAIGVSKGAAIDRILGEIVHYNKPVRAPPIDYVLCLGHFLGKDEDIYTFFEPDLPPGSTCAPRTSEKRATHKFPAGRSSSSKSHGKSSTGSTSQSSSSNKRPSPENSTITSWNVLDLKRENYFSCAVGRTCTSARYLINSSDEVVNFLKGLAAESFSHSSY